MFKKENIITVIFGLLVSISFFIVLYCLSTYTLPNFFELIDFEYPKIYDYIVNYKWLFILFVLVINILLMFLYRKIILKNVKIKK